LAVIAPSPRSHRARSPRRRLFAGWLTGVLTLSGIGLAVYSLSAPNAPAPQLPETAPPTAQTPAPVAPPQPTPTPAPQEATSPVTAHPALPQPTPPKLPDIKAASAILVDAVSGQVLYERNADVERPMASTTKVMTGLLFCENVKDDDIITASKYACETGGSSLHLKPGEKISGRDMLHAILMRSANDACVAAAEHIAGSEAAFVEKMNARAQELGAFHTHFANPHGLNAPDHYTTARDLATIARAAIADPRFSEVVRTKKYRITRSKNKADLMLKNHSRFLGKFAGADGIKTGWTIPAGHCYVGSVTQNGWRLISVVLKSPDYVTETARLMKYGFNNFRPQVIAKAGDRLGTCPVKGGVLPSVPVTVRAKVQVVLRRDETPQIERRIELSPASAPVVAGAALGSLEVLRDGREMLQAPLVAMVSSAQNPAIMMTPGRGPWKSTALATMILAVGLVSLRYGTRFAALAKSSRRRRSRLAESLRGDDRLR